MNRECRDYLTVETEWLGGGGTYLPRPFELVRLRSAFLTPYLIE